LLPYLQQFGFGLAAPQQDNSEPPLEKLISRVFVKLPIPVRQFITNSQHVLAEEDFERHKLHVAKRIGQEFIDSGCAGWAIDQMWPQWVDLRESYLDGLAAFNYPFAFFSGFACGFCYLFLKGGFKRDGKKKNIQLNSNVEAIQEFKKSRTVANLWPRVCNMLGHLGFSYIFLKYPRQLFETIFPKFLFTFHVRSQQLGINFGFSLSDALSTIGPVLSWSRGMFAMVTLFEMFQSHAEESERKRLEAMQPAQIKTSLSEEDLKQPHVDELEMVQREVHNLVVQVVGQRTLKAVSIFWPFMKHMLAIQWRFSHVRKFSRAKIGAMGPLNFWIWTGFAYFSY
jgi:hypothetical protein